MYKHENRLQIGERMLLRESGVEWKKDRKRRGQGKRVTEREREKENRKTQN
jgi:hypothetical protein